MKSTQQFPPLSASQEGQDERDREPSVLTSGTISSHTTCLGGQVNSLPADQDTTAWRSVSMDGVAGPDPQSTGGIENIIPGIHSWQLVVSRHADRITDTANHRHRTCHSLPPAWRTTASTCLRGSQACRLTWDMEPGSRGHEGFREDTLSNRILLCH